MILLDAVYINQSGGKVLLEYFIKTVQKNDLLPEFFFLFDNRLESTMLNEISPRQQAKVMPSEFNRRKFYKNLSDDISQVFCFANVPPPVKIENKEVFILFHNALILNNRNMYYSLQTQFSFYLKRLYIKYHNYKGYNWIVQTKNMSKLLTNVLNIPSDAVEIIPFYEEKRFEKVNQGLEINRGNFLYVADGVKQKNHHTLLSAWEKIYDEHQLPVTLHLTVPSKYLFLINEIIRLQNKGVSIINHGRCTYKQIQELYTNCNYFISPSLTESFGLPLIESAEAGCEIIASDLEYVYDIVNPSATFDPRNKTAIAETIISMYENNYKAKTELIITNKIKNLINLFTKNV